MPASGSARLLSLVQGALTPGVLTQPSPADRAVLPPDKPVDFTWSHIDNVATYRPEVQDLQGNPLMSAILVAGVENYRAPSWLKDRVRDSVLQLRVTAFDEQGRKIGESSWQTFRFARGAATVTTKP